MRLSITPRPPRTGLPRLDYKLDADTGILSARLSNEPDDAALTGGERPACAIVEVAGRDGSWLHLEVGNGRLAAVEIAVWPRLTQRIGMPVPEAGGSYSDVHVSADDRELRGGEVVCICANVRAMQDVVAGTLQLRFGAREIHTIVRAADAMLVGTDQAGKLRALWLLNVPALELQVVNPRA